MRQRVVDTSGAEQGAHWDDNKAEKHYRIVGLQQFAQYAKKESKRITCPRPNRTLDLYGPWSRDQP
jgi:hypothetical protein